MTDWLADHWPRPEWTDGARYLTWHLLPPPSPALHELVADHRRALAGLPGLDLVPERWLHLTVQGVGRPGPRTCRRWSRRHAGGWPACPRSI